MRHLTILTIALAASACASTFTNTRMEFDPYSQDEFRQSSDGVVVENYPMDKAPPELVAQAQRCSGMTLLVDSTGNPVTERVGLFGGDDMVYKLTITNNTDHVIRLNGMVVRLFDPTNNQYEPLDRDALGASIYMHRPCPSTQSQVLPRLNLVKMLNHVDELVPGTSTTGYLFFDTTKDTQQVPGIWKLGLYEIPAATDDAGAVVKTVKFELRTIARKYEDTYFQKGIFAAPELRDSVEID